MARRVTASHAKSRFGELLDTVTAEGRVEITKHGRVVAVLSAPRKAEAGIQDPQGTTHMIPSHLARAARLIRRPRGFHEP